MKRHTSDSERDPQHNPQHDPQHDSERDDAGEAIADIGPIDPRLELTAAYLAGWATPDQIAEFERRFVNDEDFYAYVAPAVKVWTMPVSFRELMERPPVELRAERSERLRREAAAAAQPTEPPIAPVESGATGSASPAPSIKAPAVLSVPTSVRPPRKERVGRYINLTYKVSVIAASVMLFVVMPMMYYFVLRPGRAKLIDQANAILRPAPPPGTPVPASVLPGSGAPTRSPVSRDTGRTLPVLRPDSARVAPPPAPPAPSGELAAIKPILDAIGQEFRTGANEDKVVEFENGARVLLRQNSVLRYRRPTPLPPLPGLRRAAEAMSKAAAVSIEGEAAIEVPDGSLVMVMVMSDAGYATLTSGSHAVRCVKGCAALEVAVGVGSARLSSTDTSAASLTVEQGQFGLAPRVDAPRRVDANAALNFPLPAPSIRKKP